MGYIKVKLGDVDDSGLLKSIKEELEKIEIIDNEETEESDIILENKDENEIFIKNININNKETIIEELIKIIDRKKKISLSVDAGEDFINFYLGRGFKKENEMNSDNYRLIRDSFQNRKTKLIKRINEVAEFEVKINSDFCTENIERIYLIEALENKLQSNYEIWKKIEEENEIFSRVYKELIEKIDLFFNEILNYSEISNDNIFQGIYNKISYRYNINENEKRIYDIDVQAPFSDDPKFNKILNFYKTIVTTSDYDIHFTTINYIEILRNINILGNYLNYTDNNHFFPAFYILKEKIREEGINEEFSETILNPIKQEILTLEKTIPIKKQEIIEYVDKNSKDVETWKNHLTKEVEDWAEKKKEEINVLEKTYNEKLKLEAPEKLWRKKAKEYKCSTIIWSILVFILIGVEVYSITWLMKELILIKEEKILGLFPKTFVVVAAISFFLYLTRVFIKIILSSRHMQLEAEQKAALTRFYQALIYNKKEVSENEKLIIFTALFSRSESGLIKTSDTNSDLETLMAMFLKK